MSGFIEWLKSLNEKDTKVRAVLRRSLAFDPGTFPAAYPYVEPFVKNEDNSWRREMHYLAAGLWASHLRDERTRDSMLIGNACYSLYLANDKSPSVEKRFIALLDSDRDQLPHRLRQMIALLKDYPIDFEALLKGILYWNDEQKRTQNFWARDFYHNSNEAEETKEETK